MTSVHEVLAELDLDKIRDLAEKFQFDHDALADKLAQIKVGAFDLAAAVDAEPRKKEADLLLRKIKNQANALKQSIEEMGTTSSLHGNLFHKFTKLHMLKIDLAELAQAAESIDPESKKKGDTRRNDIIITLSAKLWKTHTGKQATYTWNEGSGEFGGKFVRFLTGVAEIMDVDPAPLPQRFKRLRAQNPHF